jgi:hypothetical protein
MTDKISRKLVLGDKSALGAALSENKIEELAKKEVREDRMGGPSTEEGLEMLISKNFRKKTDFRCII